MQFTIGDVVICVGKLSEIEESCFKCKVLSINEHTVCLELIESVGGLQPGHQLEAFIEEILPFI